jgi:hypothetical protein
MKPETTPTTIAGRWIDALVRALDPGQEVCMEAELLKHFPFARTVRVPSVQHVLRMPTTAHGAP